MDLDILNINLHTKNEVRWSRHSKVRAKTRHTDILFAPVTLTLTRWPWYTNLTQIFWNVPYIKNKVSRPRLSNEQDRHSQTDWQIWPNVLLCHIRTHTDITIIKQVACWWWWRQCWWYSDDNYDDNDNDSNDAGNCVDNKHPTDCETQLAWKCLFTPNFLADAFDP